MPPPRNVGDMLAEAVLQRLVVPLVDLQAVGLRELVGDAWALAEVETEEHKVAEALEYTEAVGVPEPKGAVRVPTLEILEEDEVEGDLELVAVEDTVGVSTFGEDVEMTVPLGVTEEEELVENNVAVVLAVLVENFTEEVEVGETCGDAVVEPDGDLVTV